MEPKKPLLLLVPGLDGTGRMYEPHIPALGSRFRVKPWRFQPPPGFDFGDLVAELAGGTEDEAPGTLTIVGESFGGAVALGFVLSHPERVSRLVLINAFSRYHGRARIRIACRLSPLLRAPVFRQAKDLVAGLVLRLEGVKEPGIRHYREVVRQVDLRQYTRRLELVRDVDLQDRLIEIRAPTRILASGRDKIVPSIREGRFMASRIPVCETHEFPRAGHCLLLTPGFSLAAYV